MSSDQKNAFFAIVLSGIILFSWQYFFSPTPVNNPAAETHNASNTVAPIGASATVPSTPAQSGSIEPTVMKSALRLRQNDVSIDFSTDLSVSAMSNPQAAFAFDGIVSGASPFILEVAVDGKAYAPVAFSTSSNTESTWVGTNDELGLRAEMNYSSTAAIALKVTGNRAFKYRLMFSSEAKKLENGQIRNFAVYSDKLTHVAVGDEDSGDAAIKWAGIDYNYHLFAAYFDKPQSLLWQTDTNGRLLVMPSQAVNDLTLNFTYVKKEYNYLSSLGHDLKYAVDFGMWGFFAVWILKGLQFFYSLWPNYGLAIIGITFVVRLLTFPLQYKSFVSMKKLQLIQPELTKIREKFKDDPMRLQKESMDLFKRSGANPLGGCLPLLLQMPVFFAFYKVLYSAVELVDAPFIFWIKDLSNKDPYFVLPLLMTGAMFIQQKVTPQTVTDPMQKKVFMFMPLIFGFIMKDLPSGLSLYIFVSTVMGIAQQLLVFRMSSSTKPVVV